MVLKLPPQLESLLSAEARRRGISLESHVIEILRQRVQPTTHAPADEWERRLFGAAVDCGVSVPDAVLSSDGLYE